VFHCDRTVPTRCLDEGGAIAGVGPALPGDALLVAAELRRGLAVPAEGPVLVPDVDVGLVEVRSVLGASGVGDVVEVVERFGHPRPHG